jgi:hypothetical protein
MSEMLITAQLITIVIVKKLTLGAWNTFYVLLNLANSFWASVYGMVMASIAAVAVTIWCFDRAMSFNPNYSSPLYTKLGLVAFSFMLIFGWRILAIIYDEKRNCSVLETDG